MHTDPSSHDEHAPEDALPDRRREPRLSMVTKATLFPPIRYDVAPIGMHAPMGTRRVCLQDISYFGLRFVASTEHEPGERWRVKVEAGPMQLDGHVEVVRCEFHTRTGYEVGARFLTTDLPIRGGTPAVSVPRNPSRHLIPRK